MKVSEALISLNSFPIPTNLIEKVGIERGLDVNQDYSLAISISNEYELASADIYMWLADQPSLREQEVSINQGENTKDRLMSIANDIYAKYDDPKYTGKGKYGYVATSFNG